jgi:hypothetical protein
MDGGESERPCSQIVFPVVRKTLPDRSTRVLSAVKSSMDFGELAERPETTRKRPAVKIP